MKLARIPGKRLNKCSHLLAGLIICSLSLLQAHASSEVSRYGEHVNASFRSLERSALGRLQNNVAGFNGAPLQPDRRLVLIARELARSIASDLAGNRNVLSSSLPGKLKLKYGVYENNSKMRVFLYSTDDDLFSQLSLRYGGKRIRSTHVGVGVYSPEGPRPGAAVVIFMDKRADLSTFPKEVRVSSSHVLKGSLVYSSLGLAPVVLVTYPSGETAWLKNVRVQGDYFSSEIVFDHGPGTYWIEVVARNDRRSKVCALLKVEASGYGLSTGLRTASAAGSGTSVSSEFTLFEADDISEDFATERKAEEAVLKMINRVRKSEGLASVKVHSGLMAMARDHSRDMKEHGYSAHYSPLRGSVKSRSRLAGLSGYKIKENIALSSSLVRAMNSLLQSPVHRRNILDPEVNRAGVGVAFDDSSGTRHYYITQEFARM